MSRPPGLIILGASARAAADSAARGGITPYSIDLFADVDTCALGAAQRIERYPSEFLAALAIAPQTPWIYTGSLENYPRLIARLASMRPLLGNGLETLKLVRDPRWLAETLRGTGVQFPETRIASDFRPTDDGWLLKRRRSGGGMGIRRLSIGEPQLPVRNHFVQRYVEGTAFSASFLATRDRVEFIGAAGQWLGSTHGAPAPFHYAGSFAPFVLSDHHRHGLLAAAEELRRKANLRGLFGLDLIRNDQGLWLLEVNPRYTASMELLERLSGRSLVKEHCAAFGYDLGDEPRMRFTSAEMDPTMGKLIVYASRPGRLGRTYHNALHDLQEKKTVTAADLSGPGTTIEKGAPICTLLTSGDSVAQIEATLREAAERIRQSLDLPEPGS